VLGMAPTMVIPPANAAAVPVSKSSLCVAPEIIHIHEDLSIDQSLMLTYQVHANGRGHQLDLVRLQCDAKTLKSTQ
jgi:hypothetical protein